MNLASGLFVLIVVTQGNGVSSSNYPSLHACEEAKNIVLSGKTIEQQAADELAEKKREAAWYAAHPPRQPANDVERDVADHAKMGWFMAGTGITVRGTKDGLVQDYPSWFDDGVKTTSFGQEQWNAMVKTVTCYADVETP